MKINRNERRQAFSSVPVKSSTNSDNVPLTEIQLNTLAAPVSHQDECSNNYINYLKVAEYDAIPKYMKGRLAYNKINSVIDEINKTFEIKYKIRHQKKSTLPEKKKQIYKEYKEQENAQTQGFSFIIDANLKEHTNIRIDATLRSISHTSTHWAHQRNSRWWPDPLCSYILLRPGFAYFSP